MTIIAIHGGKIINATGDYFFGATGRRLAWFKDGPTHYQSITSYTDKQRFLFAQAFLNMMMIIVMMIFRVKWHCSMSTLF